MQFFAAAALYILFGLAAAAIWTGLPLDTSDWTIWAIIALWPFPLVGAMLLALLAFFFVLEGFDSRGGPRDG